MVILVAKPDALDQYFMKHPDDFFERSYEAAILDPHNPYVVKSNLPCAASENPITLKDEAYWSKGLPQHLDDLLCVVPFLRHFLPLSGPANNAIS